MSEIAAPADWLLDHEALLRDAGAKRPVLDLACGRGRHTHALAGWGLRVVGLDRDRAALRELLGRRQQRAGRIEVVLADLEQGRSIPLRPGSFGAVVVFRYLHRPLAPALASLLAPGGLLIYETFTVHQRELSYGPGNPDFLLEPDELPRLFPRFEVLAHREGLSGTPRPFHLAGLVARRPDEA